MEPELNENLQSLCLKSIACNFDRFNAAFYSEERKSFLMYLEILQKLYCDQILEKLADERSVKNEHLNFFINKYTKQLDLQNLRFCDFKAISERLEDVGKVIIKFSMAGIKHFYSRDYFFSHLTKVQILELADTNCTDRSLRIISENCPDLKSLDIYSCENVTDEGLMYLCEKKLCLESLNVECTSASYKGVACVLKSIPSISKLHFSNVPRALFEATGLNDPLAEKKEKVFNLSNIVIINNSLRPKNHLTEILKVCTRLCPMVNDLVVTEILSNEQLFLCNSFENVQTVYLSCSEIVPSLCSNEFLQIRGENLRQLNLSNFLVSAEVIAKCCPNLEALTLQKPIFQGVKQLNSDEMHVNFPCLKVLKFQTATFDSKESLNLFEYVIASSPNLEEIIMHFCVFPEQIDEVILKYPKKLRSLNFRNTDVSVSFIQEAIRMHKCLVNVTIENSGISTEEYDLIMDMVDEMERRIHVHWADYSEAIRLLYDFDNEANFNISHPRYILKL
ncbi:uncharacterized protein LOC118192063 [Stegodyphus dumicola]|uniref:uncharacterized protein LOC118192063 n=1 Tax=Stegodyphus dumicola TaxID=202533 RepID=UPI0015B02D4D|nr:uncharacterized protein LOC118192063 [Stegodyphus dumicola]